MDHGPVHNPAKPAEESDAAGRRAWFTLGILYLVYVSNMADRHILSILAPQIKVEMGLSDTQTGLLIGPAVALLYALLGIPLAHLADRTHRVRFVSASLAIWSACTALGAFAVNAWQLAASRLGVSASEAGGVPASTAILGDLFPPHRRALALSIFSTGSTCGIFVSFGLGGLIGHHFGWRIALLAAGLPGIILSGVLLLTVREPVRGRLDPVDHQPAQQTGIIRTVMQILSVPVYRRTLAGAALLNVAISTTLAWGPSFAIRKFGLNSAAVGGSIGIGIALIGGLFIIAGGFIMGRLGTARVPHALRLIAIAQMASLGLFFILLVAPSFAIAVTALSLVYGTLHLYIPAYYAVAQNHVPYRLRASTVALGVLAMTLMGSGLAPPLIGLLSDILRPRLGAFSLEVAMAPALLAILCGAALLWRAADTLPHHDQSR